MNDTAWPLQGLLYIARRPRLWLRCWLAVLMTWLALVAVAALIAWWAWPATPGATALSHLWWWLAVLRALGFGAAGAFATWVLCSPLLMSWALDHLAAAVHAEQGLPVVDAPMLRSVSASLRVLVNTLPLRLAYALLAIAGAFLGPIGVLIAFFGMAHVAAIDSADICLGVRGYDGLTRVRLIREHRHELARGAVSGGLLNLALGSLVVAWLMWLPAMVAGMALRTAQWPEIRNRLPAA